MIKGLVDAERPAEQFVLTPLACGVLTMYA